MKFSTRKKEKMRRIRAKRIRRHYGVNAIGCTVDWEEGFKATDQMNIGDVWYLLAKNEDEEYALYRIVDLFRYARIGSKRIWQMRDEIECKENWINKTDICIVNDNMNGAIIGVYK